MRNPRPIRMSLVAYSAVSGSVSVMTAALISLPFPNPWAAWVFGVLAIVFMTVCGLSADRVVEVEDDG